MRNLFFVGSLLLLLLVGSMEGDTLLGLQAYYALNGNVLDSSGNGNHATDSGNVRYTAGISGQARDFDRVDGNEYILAPNTVNGTSYTISMWFNLRSVETHNSLFMINSGSNFGTSDFWFFTSGNKLAFYHNQTNLRTGVYLSAFENSATLSNNVWYCAIMTYENQNLTVYLNGQLYAQYTNVPNFSSAAGINIGISPSGSGLYQIDGMVDEIRIYNRAINSSEIVLLSVPEPSLALLVTLGMAFLAWKKRK